MKKILMTALFLFFAFALPAQERKMLSLEQTSTAAYQQRLIDAQQKHVIDSMIVRLSRDRKALELEKRAGKVSGETYKASSKKLSQNFTDELKRVLGATEAFRQWQTVRHQR